MPTRSSATKKVSNKALAMRRHRAKMRRQGMKLVQFWVPDTSSPEFAKACERASRALSKSPEEQETLRVLDGALDYWLRNDPY